MNINRALLLEQGKAFREESKKADADYWKVFKPLNEAIDQRDTAKEAILLKEANRALWRGAYADKAADAIEKALEILEGV